MKTFQSDISNKSFSVAERISGHIVQPNILGLIQSENPSFTIDSHLSISELNQYREKYLRALLERERLAISGLEGAVLASISNETTLADKIEFEDNTTYTYGQRLADNVATFGGSWTFIIAFGVFLFIWIITNVFVLVSRPFDPYPFIFLNLILSCIAALQAPVIMMSQNRQEEKDRTRAKKDYMINLKAELEIRMLHEKIDHLILHQQQDLLEIQNIQVDMLKDVLNKFEKSTKQE
ncbi:MAG: hypothetical protein RLZZ91_1658 [Bacteroidota bacterium]|jgi:uncharacterized membrane protein